jgi:hypothetical protein
VEAARLPMAKSRWRAAKWAAVIGVCFAAVVGAETLRRSFDHTGTDAGETGSSEAENHAGTAANTSSPLADFKDNLNQMLRLEKEIALDAAETQPADAAAEKERQKRSELLRTLQERDRQLRKRLGHSFR